MHTPNEISLNHPTSSKSCSLLALRPENHPCREFSFRLCKNQFPWICHPNPLQHLIQDRLPWPCRARRVQNSSIEATRRFTALQAASSVHPSFPSPSSRLFFLPTPPALFRLSATRHHLSGHSGRRRHGWSAPQHREYTPNQTTFLTR